jgi:hypothetical protein
MIEWFSQNSLLTFFAFATGLVSILQLLEYLQSKNIPWLFRVLRGVWKRVKRRFRGSAVTGGTSLVLNFSGHPVMPGQIKTIEKQLHWPKSRVIDVPVGTVAEDRKFVANVVKAIEHIDLSPEEWQRAGIVVIPAGYSAIWSVVLAELHGRLGYFPDVVHLRPSPPASEEKFEVAEIMNLREVRHASREKR